MTEVNISKAKLANYLSIALKQKERAAQKFVQDYGPSSAAVAEINGECAKLKTVINQLHMEDTPIESEINKKKGA